MRTVPTVALVLVGALVVALLATGSVAAADASQDDHLEPCATESPENYTAPEDGDAIGYVDGYWYDQPIRIANDTDDGTSDGNESSGNATSDDGSNGDGSATDGDRSTDDGNETATDGANVTATNRTQTDEGDGNVSSADDGNESTTSTSNGSTTSDGNETDDGASWDEGRPLDVSDGLDDREIEAIVTRTAARVETQRCLSFQSVPDVRVINRSVLETEQRAALTNRTTAERRFDDARLSAAMLVGNQVGSTEARAATLSSSSMGYYDPATDELVLVADDDQSFIDEPTLAHELVHALQDQRFDLDTYDANLTDAALAETGLIEGDASLVQHRYQRRCADGDWSDGCLRAPQESDGNSDYLALELFFFQPYNDGAHYVERLYDEGGWAAVDAQYADVPTSSAALLSPETSPNADPVAVSFDPVTDSDWQRVAPEAGPDYDRLGPGTIAAAMLAPTFDEDLDEIYGAQRVRTTVEDNRLHPLYPYDYGVDAATGWEGGKLEVYRTDDDTAVRWRTEWESETDAETFRDRYVELLAIRGDAESGEYVDTYAFSGDANFEGRISVRQNGTTVTVVQGPSLTALRTLDERAATDERTGSSSSIDGAHAAQRESQDDRSQGPLGAIGQVAVAGGTVGLVALVVASAWLVVRRRRDA